MPARKPLAEQVARAIGDVHAVSARYLPESTRERLAFAARHMPTLVRQVGAADAVLNLEPASRTYREKVAIARDDWTT